MNDTSLADRYVSAAMRTVPEKTRPDLAAELRASIDDQIDARMGAGERRDAAELAVITGLGDPEKLAAGYTGRPLYVIGPRYYLTWRRLLKILLWSAVPAAGGAVALGQVIAGASVGEVVGTVVVTLQLVALHVVFWTTVVFALIERYQGNEPVIAPWTPDHLPEPTAQGTQRVDVVVPLVFLGIGAGAIVWDLVIGLAPAPGGPVPLLHPALWPWGIAGLFAAIAGQAALILVVHRARRWTIPLATVQTVLSVVVAVAAIALLRAGELVNPAWIAAFEADVDAEALRVLGIVTGFVIAGVAVWAAIDAYRKAFACRRASR